MTTPASLALARGVTRLCHFTPSLNLPHIVRDGHLRPTADLSADVRACFSATDLERLDGHPDCICCSIEFPNAHYLARARQQGRLAHFPDWIVFFLDPSLLDREGVLFSPRNAAAGYGAHLRPGSDGLERCYAPAVVGAGGRTFTRTSFHLAACPTDEQAEVLIPGHVSVDHVWAIAVRDDSQARREVARLRAVGLTLEPVPILIAPTLFASGPLSAAIRGGERPTETLWNEEGGTHA